MCLDNISFCKDMAYFIRIIFFLSLPVFLFSQSPLEKENFQRVSNYINLYQEDFIVWEERPLLVNYGGFGSSILVQVDPGRDSWNYSSGPGSFVFAVPLDVNYAVDTAIVLIDKLIKNGGSDRILIAFLGDENNSLPGLLSSVSHRGLEDLLNLADIPENWVLCYFNVNEAPERLMIHHGVRGYVTPREILEPLVSILNLHGIPWSFSMWFNEIYNLGLVEGPRVLSMAWEEEINGFVLSGESGRASQDIIKTVLAEDITEFIFNYATSLEFPILISDYHYSLLPLPGNRVFFSGEGFIAVLALVVVGVFLILFLIYSAIYNAVINFHTRLFLRHIWIFLIFLPLLVLSIRISGIIYSRFYTFFNGPAYYVNYFGAFLTLALAALIFFIPSPVLNFIRFPRRAQFYGFSAVFIIILGLLFSTFLDFSYILIFLWAFIFVFIGAMVSRPVIIFICALMVPAFALGVLINIAITGSTEFTELFVSSNWEITVNWFLSFETALLVLPLILLLKRGTILVLKSYRKGLEIKPNRMYRIILLPALIIFILGVMIIHIHLIQIIQPSSERRQYTAAGDELKISLEDTLFQDSRIVTFTIEASVDPVRFDFSLESETGRSLLPIYSSNIPFQRLNDGRSISFTLGEYPPNPLTFEIAVPVDFNSWLYASAVYNVWDPLIDPESIPLTEDYILVINRTMEFR